MADGLEDKYVCTLDESSKQRARKELNEDEKNRDGAIQTLRDWVKQQPWLKSPTDAAFLIRFLRTHKYSQLESRQVLTNFWTRRTKHHTWFENIDPCDPKIQEVIDTGFVLRLPRSDKDGRIYIMQRPGVLNIQRMEKIGIVNIFRAFTIVRDMAILMDERSQINGVVLTGDFSGYTIKHKTTLFTTENMKIFLSTMQECYPARIKQVNICNINPLFEPVFAIMKTLMKPKLRGRDSFYCQLKVHARSLVSLYETIDMSVLPDEYLPDDYTGPSSGSIQSIVEGMKKDMMKPETVNYFKQMTSSGYGVDAKLKSLDDDIPSVSFRKLNVD